MVSEDVTDGHDRRRRAKDMRKDVDGMREMRLVEREKCKRKEKKSFLNEKKKEEERRGWMGTGR